MSVSISDLDFFLFLKSLLGMKGLMSSNNLEQEAAINSLSTLMSIIPGDTYAQFQKVHRMLRLSAVGFGDMVC